MNGEAPYRRSRPNGRTTTDVVTLLTCHNRREKTLTCLESLFRQQSSARKTVVLVDDGSTDGTANQVRTHFPDVLIVPGTGSLFWGGGMRLATAVARSRFDAKFHLWLNDDVTLMRNAFEVVLTTFENRKLENDGRYLVVGALEDPTTGLTSYSGLVRSGSSHRLRFKLVDPSGEPQVSDTMNGNVVLIPTVALRTIGTLDPLFTHSMGDTDYGLRAGKAGWQILVTPTYVGTCSRNPPTDTFAEPRARLRVRLRRISSPKGLPFQAWATYTKRHGGVLWPVYFALPYLGMIFSTMPFFRRRYLKRKGFSRED